MKLFTYVSTIIFMAAIFINAQVPNSGFENWTNGNPDGWVTDNLTGGTLNVTQSGDAHSGSSSAKLQVVNYYGVPYPAELWTFSNTSPSSIPQTLTGYYKYVPSSNNTGLAVGIELYKNGSDIGAGADTLKPTSSYTQFSLPIYYVNSEIPDSIYIYIDLVDSTISGATGSYANFDDLSFGKTTGINNKFNSPITFQLKQNYPNPFNPTTTIEYQIPKQSHVVLEIYNVLGDRVKTLVNKEESAGNYKINFNASNLPSGVYFYRIEAGNFNQSKKLILLK